jgi:hypothetical protein
MRPTELGVKGNPRYSKGRVVVAGIVAIADIIKLIH